MGNRTLRHIHRQWHTQMPSHFAAIKKSRKNKNARHRWGFSCSNGPSFESESVVGLSYNAVWCATIFPTEYGAYAAISSQLMDEMRSTFATIKPANLPNSPRMAGNCNKGFPHGRNQQTQRKMNAANARPSRICTLKRKSHSAQILGMRRFAIWPECEYASERRAHGRGARIICTHAAYLLKIAVWCNSSMLLAYNEL